MGLWPACILNAGSSFEKYSDKWQRGGGVILIPTFPYSSPTIPQFFFHTEMVMVLNWTNVTQIGTISSISSTYSPIHILSKSWDVQRYYLCSLLIDLIIFTLWKAEYLSYKVTHHPKKDDPKAIFQDFSLLCCQEKGLSKRRFQPNAAAVIALGRWADRRLERDKAPPDVLRRGGVASKEVWRRGCKNKMFDRCSCCSSKKRSLLSTFWYQDKCLTGIWTRRIETTCFF